MKKIFEKIKNAPMQVKASFAFLVCSFLGRGAAIITTPLFTRMMTTSEYGSFGVFNSWVSIISCFVTLNLSGGIYAQCLVKYSESKEKYKSSFQGLTLCLSIIFGVIYLIFRNSINSFLGYSTDEMIMMLMIIWTSAVYHLWAAGQRVEYRYRLLSIISISSTVLTALLGIFFVFKLKDKVFGRILGWCITQVVLFAWLFFFDIRKGKILFSKEIWKYAINMAFPLIPHYLSTIILNSSDRIMIKEMIDESSAGIYNLAYSLSLIMTVFNSSLLSTIEPWIYKQIKSGNFKKIEKVAYPSFLGIALLNILLIAFAPEIIFVFAPKTYYDAKWVVPPVAMSVYFMFLYSFFATFEFYYEKTKFITFATVTGAIVNVVTNYIFIKIFGYVAAGYTTLLCYIIFAIMHYIFMNKIAKENIKQQVYNIKIIFALTIGFMVIGFALLLSYNVILIRYGIVLILIIVIICLRKKIIDYCKYIMSVRKENKIEGNK